MRNLKRVLSLALALVMVLGMMVITTSAADFTDADEITNTEAVDVMSALGVITGDNGKFYPNRVLTREEGAAFICYMLMGKDNADKLVGSGNFADVKADRWSAGEIDYCSNLGIVKGVGDGKFNPKGELTAVQFGGMLLGALGYDGKIEGYTGSNWATAIAADMIDIGLDVKGVAMDAQLTREQAAQMAFQALTATMVAYDGGVDITTGDTTVKVDADRYDRGNTAVYTDTLGMVGLQFAERYFSDLSKTAGADDDFARPADHGWAVDGKPVSNTLKTPVASYVNNFNGKAIEDLEDKGYTVPADVTVKYNGGTTAEADALNELYINKMTGVNGFNVELYDTNKDKTIDLVIVTEGYFATIGEFTAAKGQNKAKVEVKVAEENMNETIIVTDDDEKTTDLYDVLAKYSKDDAIMVYCAPGWDADKTEASILAVEDVTAVAGTISKVNVGTYNCTTTVVIDGETYALNNECQDGKSWTAGVTGTLYLDAQGNGIGWVGEKKLTPTTYAYVLDVDTNVNASVFGTAKTMAQLLLADGTVVEVEYKMAAGQTALATDDTNKIVKYVVDEDGVYTLTNVTADTGVTAITKNTATLKSRVYADSKTVFVVASTGAGGKTVYTVYTGIANVPSMTSVTSYTAVKDYHADVVFVTASTSVNAPAEKAIFVTDESAQEVKELAADGKTVLTYYVQNAVVDGEITTIKSSSKLNGVYSSIITDKNGIVTTATPATTSPVTAVVEYVNGVLNIDGGFKGYVENAVCYIADKNTGAISVGTIANLSDDDTYTGWYTTKDGIVTGLYLIG